MNLVADLGNGTWADVPRVLALVLGSAVMGVTLVVVAVYTSIYLVHRRLSRAHAIPQWRGLLPRHVALVGISYLLLTGFSMYSMLTFVREPLTWRPFGYGTAYALGLWALWDVLGSSRHRKHEYDLRRKDLPPKGPTTR